MSDREIIKATNPDPDDAASHCDDCGAEPSQPCEPGCACLCCSIGTVDCYAAPTICTRCRPAEQEFDQL